jgi:hypothetical protein
MADCCKPKRTWATHPRTGDEKVAYFAWVLHTFDGHAVPELGILAKCEHRHASRDEAQACADKLPIP